MYLTILYSYRRKLVFLYSTLDEGKLISVHSKFKMAESQSDDLLIDEQL